MGAIWEREGKAKSNWEIQAENTCRGEGYKVLLFSDLDARYDTIGMVLVGAMALEYPDTVTVPQVDGVIHCRWSNLTEQEAMQVLRDEYYLLPGQP